MAAIPGTRDAPTATERTLAERLIHEWYSIGAAEIPDRVLARTALCVQDTIGVAFAARKLGVGMAPSRIVEEMGSTGMASVWGTTMSASAEDAAFANGTAAHALDFDDTHAAAIMHASAVIVPPALALGEERGASGREILAALVVGYQVAARLGRLAPGPFQDHGFQATSVLGTFAAAAVASRLLGLTPDQALGALGIAGSMASGLMAYLSDGSDVKQMHPGWAGMSGIRAARMSKAGFRGPHAVFEDRLGVFRSFARVDISEKWRGAGGAPWEVELMAPKPYPACLCVHAPVQAILELRHAGKISAARAGDIASIECDVPNWYVGLIFEPSAGKVAPRTPYEARFSAPWTMARALIDGGIDVWSFSPENIADPAAREIAAKVSYKVEELPEFPESFPARVTVTMRSGEKHVSYIRHNLGTPDNPMSAEDMRRKFFTCATPGIGEARAREISQRIGSLAEPGAAKQLFELLHATQVR